MKKKNSQNVYRSISLDTIGPLVLLVIDGGPALYLGGSECAGNDTGGTYPVCREITAPPYGAPDTTGCIPYVFGP